MNTDGTSLHLKAETHHILGADMAVMNDLGHGFHEKPYENALVVEFAERNIPSSQQPRFPALYKGHIVGEYIPDRMCTNKSSWIPKPSKTSPIGKSGK